MKFTVFEELSALCVDFDICKSAFMRGHDAAKDISAAVRSRLEAERVQTAERISELEQRKGDPGCGVTVRRMIDLELEQLQNRAKPAPTPEEVEAFRQEITAAEDAVRDMQALRAKIRQAIDAANTEAKQVRSETLGFDVDLRGGWLDGIRRDFDCLRNDP